MSFSLPTYKLHNNIKNTHWCFSLSHLRVQNFPANYVFNAVVHITITWYKNTFKTVPNFWQYLAKAKMALNEAESRKKIKEKEAFIFVSLNSDVQKPYSKTQWALMLSTAHIGS